MGQQNKDECQQEWMNSWMNKCRQWEVSGMNGAGSEWNQMGSFAGHWSFIIAITVIISISFTIMPWEMSHITHYYITLILLSFILLLISPLIIINAISFLHFFISAIISDYAHCRHHVISRHTSFLRRRHWLIIFTLKFRLIISIFSHFWWPLISDAASADDGAIAYACHWAWLSHCITQ